MREGAGQAKGEKDSGRDCGRIHFCAWCGEDGLAGLQRLRSAWRCDLLAENWVALPNRFSGECVYQLYTDSASSLNLRHEYVEGLDVRWFPDEPEVKTALRHAIERDYAHLRKVRFVPKDRTQFLTTYAGDWFTCNSESLFFDRFDLLTSKPLLFMRDPRFLPISSSCGVLAKLR